MKPYLYTFISLLFTACISYKKQVLPIKISNINQLPLSSTKSKCIVLKKQKEKGIYMPNEYFYFFPTHNIFLYQSMAWFPMLGYYHFEKSAVDSNQYLYLKAQIMPRDGIYFEQKSIKNSADSIYINVKLATVARFPFDEYQPFKLEVEKNSRGRDSVSKIDNFSLSILLDSIDSCEFIIAFKRDSNIKNVNIFNYYRKCNIDTIHNFYEVRGTFCCKDINSNMEYQVPQYWDNNDTYEISKINTNTYEFAQIESSDSVTIKKTIYTWQHEKSLYDYEKEPLYMLPTFIKILECSGTYPRK